MKKKIVKGFTLVELLAVIILLSIISLITITIVSGIVKDSRKSSLVVSVKSYASGINENLLSAKIRKENISDGTYNILSNGNLCIGQYSNNYCDGKELEININSGNPTSGEVVIANKQVTKVLNANINGEVISYDVLKNKEIISDAVLVSAYNATRYTNKIEIDFTPVNAKNYKCEYGTTETYGSEGTFNNSKNKCTISDLTPGETYYYKITVSNGEKSDYKQGSMTTLPLTVNPTIAIAPSGFTTSKTATISYSEGTETAHIINPNYYFYTTSTATSNIAVANCGIGLEPSTCSNELTTNLKANNWYKLNDASNVTITYLLNSTIIARTDENNVPVGYKKELITSIDNNKPVITVKNIKYGEKAELQLYDNQSGITHYAVTKTNNVPTTTSNIISNNLNVWYPVNSDSITERMTKEFSGLDAGEYYAWAKDGLGNYSNTSFTVAKINDKITITPVTKVYDKSNATPTITTISGINPSTTYYSDSKCTTVATPKNAGTYYVIATTQGNTNYKPANSGCTNAVTIQKSNLTNQLTCSNKIYDDTTSATCTIKFFHNSTQINGTGTCNFDNKNVGINKTITCTNFGLTNELTSNFNMPSTLTATGNINNAKIVFDANGGTLSGTSTLYSQKNSKVLYTGLNNTTQASTPTATRTGYTFKGWYSATSGGTKYFDGTKAYDKTTDVTLYAQWEPNTITVNYYANGAPKNASGATVNNLLQTDVLTYDGRVEYQWPKDYPNPWGFTLVYPGYESTGVYHVGSSNSSTTIPQDFIKDASGVTVITLAERLGLLSQLQSGNVTLNLYAGWKQAEKPTISCSVYNDTQVATQVTGTTTKTTGYLVGNTIKCECTGTSLNPTSLTLKNGSTKLSSASGNGTNKISASYTVNSPGAVTITAECSNVGNTATSDISKDFYREFTLTFNKNGASSISSTGGTQYLMANSTVGNNYYSSISRNDGTVVGWHTSPTATKNPVIYNNTKINLCYPNTDACNSTPSGTVMVANANYTLYAITYVTIPVPQTYTPRGTMARASVISGSNLEVIDDGSNVKVYNTRSSIVVNPYGMCAWVWGGTLNISTFGNEAHTGGAHLVYGNRVKDFGETYSNFPEGDGFTIPISYNDKNQWWCDTIGNGWNLTIDPNGGTYDGTTGKKNKTVQYGSRVNNNIGVSTRTGYTFDGWYDVLPNDDGIMVYDSTGKASDTTTYWYYPGTSKELAIWKTYGSDIKLFAHWTPNKNTLVVNPNGGSVVFNGATRTSSSSATQNYNTTISVPNPTRSATTVDDGTITITYDEHGGTTVSDATLTKKKTTAYDFTGWTNSETCGDMSGTTYTFPSNNGKTCTKTAGWSETYNNFTSPTSITLPSISRTGYKFDGWYTAASGGTRVGASLTTISPTASATYHAHWTAKTYSVTFNPNYTTGSGQHQSPAPTTSREMTYGSTTNNNVPITGYSRTGYTFLGWYTATTGGTQVFDSSGAAIANTTYWNASKQWKYDGTVTFYAHWKAN